MSKSKTWLLDRMINSSGTSIYKYLCYKQIHTHTHMKMKFIPSPCIGYYPSKDVIGHLQLCSKSAQIGEMQHIKLVEAEVNGRNDKG